MSGVHGRDSDFPDYRRITVEAKRRLKVVRNWLYNTLPIIHTNNKRVEYFRGSNLEEYELWDESFKDVNLSWLYLNSAYFDEANDEFSNPEDYGYHLEFIITFWNGPLNIPGIIEKSRKIIYDDYRKPTGTEYSVVVNSPQYISEIQSLYLAQSWKESVKDA